MPEEATQNSIRGSILNEIIAIIFLAVGILLILCLFTFNPNDSTVNTAGSVPTQNLIGTIGANVAVFLLQTIGLTAYLVPFLFLLAAWKYFRSETIYTPPSRVIGLIVSVFSLASLFALIFGTTAVFDASTPVGGLFGTLIARFLASGLSAVGAGILIVAGGFVAFLLATNASLAFLLGDVNYLWAKIRTFFNQLSQRFNEWREHQAELARERTEHRRSGRTQAPILANQKVENVRPPSNGIPAKQNVAENPDVVKIQASTPPGWTFSRFGESVGNFFRRLQEPPPEDEADFDENEIPAAIAKTKTEKKPAAQKAVADEKDGKNDFPEISADEIYDEVIEGEQITPTIAASESSKTAGASPNNGALSPFSETGEISGSLIRERLLSLENEAEDAADEFEESNEPFDLRPTASPKVFTPENYQLPPSDILTPPPPKINQADDELLDIARQLTEKCKEFKVNGQVVNICPGPIVTTYEYKLDAGIKLAQVTKLVDDLCLALKAESMRIDRIPGKAFVGMEVPNSRREIIYLRDVIESKAFRESESLLTIALGKTVDGLNHVTDLAKMPHLLIAGATGAGKSVGVNSLIVSILYKARPDQVKFIMVDPKQVELGIYEDIPHLATPIITDPKRAAISLKWAVSEMERRYKQLASWSVRNLVGYNTEVIRRNFVGEFDEDGAPWKSLPYIVIIIDEFADLMLVARKDVEESVTRLAQMARAVGIHLVLATQRPSTDIITGIIKANFPSRIAFRVSVSYDSRTIIDGVGAENLLGRGDMLFLPPGTSRLVRIHGAFVDEKEIAQIITHIKSQAAPDYDTSITQTEEEAVGINEIDEDRDDLFEDALKICVEMKRASTSVLQRRLSIGYGRAAKIIDAMEREGFVGKAEGSSKPRPILDKARQLIGEWEEQESSM